MMTILRIVVSAYALWVGFSLALAGYLLYGFILGQLDAKFIGELYAILQWAYVFTGLGWLLVILPTITVLYSRLNFLFNPGTAWQYGAIAGVITLLVTAIISIFGIMGLFLPLAYYFAAITGAFSLKIYSLFENHWRKKGEPQNKWKTIFIIAIQMSVFCFLYSFFYQILPKPEYPQWWY